MNLLGRLYAKLSCLTSVYTGLHTTYSLCCPALFRNSIELTLLWHHVINTYKLQACEVFARAELTLCDTSVSVYCGETLNLPVSINWIKFDYKTSWKYISPFFVCTRLSLFSSIKSLLRFNKNRKSQTRIWCTFWWHINRKYLELASFVYVCHYTIRTYTFSDVLQILLHSIHPIVFQICFTWAKNSHILEMIHVLEDPWGP